MELVPHLRRLFDYDAWANREAIASLRKSGPPSPRSLALMAHVVAAEWLWLNRLRREPQPMPVWPEMGLDACESHVAELAPRWREYVAELTEAKLVETVVYTNTRGEPFKNATHDILSHVVMHSAYHRGQLAAEVRASGRAPAYTDFIHCVRQGFID